MLASTYVRPRKDVPASPHQSPRSAGNVRKIRNFSQEKSLRTSLGRSTAPATPRMTSRSIDASNCCTTSPRSRRVVQVDGHHSSPSIGLRQCDASNSRTSTDASMRCVNAAGRSIDASNSRTSDPSKGKPKEDLEVVLSKLEGNISKLEGSLDYLSGLKETRTTRLVDLAEENNGLQGGAFDNDCTLKLIQVDGSAPNSVTIPSFPRLNDFQAETQSKVLSHTVSGIEVEESAWQQSGLFDALADERNLVMLDLQLHRVRVYHSSLARDYQAMTDALNEEAKSLKQAYKAMTDSIFEEGVALRVASQAMTDAVVEEHASLQQAYQAMTDTSISNKW